MSRTTRSLMLTVMLGLVTTGCTARYHCRINTYLSDELPFPSAAQGVKITVVAEADPHEPLLEREVRRKIEHLLRERGYNIGAFDDTDYVLLALFAIDTGTTVSGTYDVYVPGGVATTNIYTSSGQWATATTHLPGRREQRSYRYTFFTRFVGMTLFDHRRFLIADQEHKDDAIVWRSTTASSGRSSDLRSVIDYMLVLTFEYFGQDTSKQVRETLSAGDKRVKSLREAMQSRTRGEMED